MWQRRVYDVMARALAVMVGWIVLMGLPLLFFHGPLDVSQLKPFLGVFYALMLAIGTVLSRAWGGSQVLLFAFPFLVLFSAVGGHYLVDGTLAWGDRLAALDFLVIYGVVFLAWRLGLAARPALTDDETFM